jgi:translation initiation factor 2B subunit (eIF-2B alpha/beta/delta family)/8-oxo-dGTP pyrophosphatase MutT (NUDIX family)
MDSEPLVTCFLRHGTEVLLVQRSDAAGGLWDGVSADAEGDPEAAARSAIDEEVGLLEPATFVRTADPLVVQDHERGTPYHVHPFLFDCEATGVEPNDDIAATEWVQPPEIRTRDTVPDLWRTYRAIAPSVESVAGDTDHGSAYVSLRALEVLRDTAADAAANDGDAAAVLERAADLRTARSAMGVVRNRLDRVLAEADGDTDPPTAVDCAAVACERALAVDDEAAAAAADRVGDRVLTLSRSGTVLQALGRADPEAVFVAESRPAREGVGVAEALADDGLDVTLCVDAAVAHVAATEAVDTVLVGADSVLADGTVVNKVGTRPAALAAADVGADCYAVCATDKVVPDSAVDPEPGPPDAVQATPARVAVRNPTFEATPPGHFTGIVTEAGVLSPADVAAIAADHAAVRATADAVLGDP